MAVTILYISIQRRIRARFHHALIAVLHGNSLQNPQLLTVYEIKFAFTTKGRDLVTLLKFKAGL